MSASQSEGKDTKFPNSINELNLPNEAFSFGNDEYIKAWVNLAECLMHMNQHEKAAEKYETVKRRIQGEVVFDKPVMLINTCN